MTLHTIITRTREQRAKFAALPDEAVNLNVLYVRPHPSCHAVGCLLGWIEYDLEQRGVRDHPRDYLGLLQVQTPAGDELFDRRHNDSIAPKAEGLARYDQRITELKALATTGGEAG